MDLKDFMRLRIMKMKMIKKMVKNNKKNKLNYYFNLKIL